MRQQSLDEFLALAKTSNRIAVYQEILAEHLNPIGIAENLTDEIQEGAMLESGLCHQDIGHYSFIAFGKMAQLRVQNKVTSLHIGTTVTTHTTHPFDLLRQLLSQFSCPVKISTGDFINGAIGFMSYDAIRLFESIPDRHLADNPFPEILFNIYQTTLMLDHQKHTLLLNVAVEVGDDPEKTYREAREKISTLIEKITTPNSPTLFAKKGVVKDTPVDVDVDVDVDDEQFMQLIRQAQEHIIQGDAFQIVLSRCFKKKYSVTPFAIYRALRNVCPAPYMFYLPIGDSIIIGASPEKLVSVRNRRVENNPIAGTRQSTATKSHDVITQELLQDDKELAEHMMLVDLARNDLGVVCKPGSVKVEKLLQVKHYSHISHITSLVTGELQDNKDALDALAAAFPAGTLTGAPKIRAMEIIDALETSKRGLYGGAICRLDDKGNLDSCIAIRMAVLKDGTATVRAGAGVVYDSNPAAEANETRQKASGILDAISIAEKERTC